MAALQTLMEMGFSENGVKKALAVTGGGVEQAMEWLLAHADDPGINDPPAAAEGDAAQATGTDTGVEKMETEGSEGAAGGEGAASGGAPQNAEAAASVDESQEEARSIKCDDCGKLFKTSEEVEFHAVKSGHSNFSESTEEKKPLSEEEKQQKKRELEQKIKQRRKEREESEAREVLEREKKRIQMGQEIAERKRLMQEEEMKRIVEERKKEKLEDKLARQKVKDDIERDKQARREKERGGQAAASAPKPQASPAAPPAQKKDYTTARLQIRLPDGKPMVHEFKAKEPLSAVRLWISLNRQDDAPPEAPFNLSTSYPRKIFQDEDMDKPLEVLGLVPTAVLIVSK